MAEPTTFPYETRLNILHGPLELIDVHAVPGANDYKWFNQTLCKVNNSVVRMAAIEGEYHWHKHDEDDEFFYVVEGSLLIDLEDQMIELNPGQGFVVPRTVLHRTPAPERTVILMVEKRRYHLDRKLSDPLPLPCLAGFIFANALNAKR